LKGEGMPTTVSDQKYTPSNSPVVTTNLTTATILVFDVPPGAMGTVRAEVNARSSGGLVRSFSGVMGVERPVGGSARTTATTPFGLTASGGDLLAASWIAQLDVSNNQVRIRVTGAAGTTIEWWGICAAYWSAAVTP
jgi:hypothetical protein